MLVRFRAGEGGRRASPSFVEFVLAVHDHDTARARAQLPDDFTYFDHRRAARGRLGTADDYVASLATLWELSPDACAETRRDVADAERARARFAAWHPGPHAVVPNAATRAMERRGGDLSAGQGWEALRASAGPGFVFEDRRRRALVSGGAELWIQHLQIVAGRPERHACVVPVATVGERIALLQLHDTLSGGQVEGEFLLLVEVDEDDRLAAWIHFDVEDRAAAASEANARGAAHEAARS
jgi:hypothetical protein